VIVLALCTIGIGFYAESIFLFSEATSHQLLNPQQYIDAVLQIQEIS